MIKFRDKKMFFLENFSKIENGGEWLCIKFM